VSTHVPVLVDDVHVVTMLAYSAATAALPLYASLTRGLPLTSTCAGMLDTKYSRYLSHVAVVLMSSPILRLRHGFEFKSSKLLPKRTFFSPVQHTIGRYQDALAYELPPCVVCMVDSQLQSSTISPRHEIKLFGLPKPLPA
jgi:hypothetical protein